MRKYKLIVSGGTFDHFHKGHKTFLHFQFSLSDQVLIGITSNTYIANYKNVGIEPYQTRVKAVEDFLKKEKMFGRAKILPIDDVYLPNIWKKELIEAITVTEETRRGAELINEKRAKEGLSLLPIVLSPLEYAQDGITINSTRIRNGKINRNGEVYLNKKWLSSDLILPKTLRKIIARPIGPIIQDIGKVIKEEQIGSRKIISVGDIVTDTCNNLEIHQKISIVDLLVQRKQQFASLSQHHFTEDVKRIDIVNKAGTLSHFVFQELEVLLKVTDERQYVLVIDGEEDLAVLPVIISAPLDVHIFYGQPHEGVVHVTVTEEIKEMAKRLLQRFTEAKIY